MVFWKLSKNNNKLLFTKKVRPNSLLLHRVSLHCAELRDSNFYSVVLLNFLVFYTFSLIKIFKLEMKFLFYYDRSPATCLLVRPAKSLDSIRRLQVKTYLSWSLNLIFKYLGFDCQVKLDFFLWLLFWGSVQFEFTYITCNNRQMSFPNVRSETIVRSNNHR